MQRRSVGAVVPCHPRALAWCALTLACCLASPTAATGAATKRPAHPAPAAAKPAPVARSPLAGHWEADLQGDGKHYTFVFDLTTKGDSLGGVLGIVGRDGDIPIAGTIRGNKLHFEQFGLWDGTLDGANLKLTRGLDGGKVQHLVAHRVAGK